MSSKVSHAILKCMEYGIHKPESKSRSRGTQYNNNNQAITISNHSTTEKKNNVINSGNHVDNKITTDCENRR